VTAHHGAGPADASFGAIPSNPITAVAVSNKRIMDLFLKIF
jgi:hypothetical protein